jgi:hypothetical protein
MQTALNIEGERLIMTNSLYHKWAAHKTPVSNHSRAGEMMEQREQREALWRNIDSGSSVVVLESMWNDACN